MMYLENDLIISEADRRARVRFDHSIDVQALSALVSYAAQSGFSKHAWVRPAKEEDKEDVDVHIDDLIELPF